jgi:hypothetical protein
MTSTMDSPATVSFAVTSELMQDFRLASPVTGYGRIALASGEDGQVEVFAVGSDGHVYNIRHDAGSDTGWALSDLGLPSVTSGRVNSVAACREAGVSTVYALDTSNALYAIQDRRWGAGWQQIANPYGYNVEEIRSFQGDQGESVVAALCRGSNSSFSFFVLGPEGWGGAPSELDAVTDWSPARVQSTGPGQPVWPGVFAAAEGSNGVRVIYSGCYAGGQSDVYGRFADGDYSIVACTVGDHGYSEVFAVSAADSSLCYLSPSPAGTFTPLSLGSTAIRAVSPGRTSSGLLKVFAAGQDGRLYHSRQSEAGGWTPLTCLDESATFSQVAAIQDADGDTMAFAVTADHRLYQVSQDPDSTDWTVEEIELSVRGSVEQGPSYTMRLTAYDSLQQPAPNIDVTLYSDAPVVLTIDGVSCFVDAGHPWSGVTGAGGQLTIGRAADALGVPVLTVWTSSMPPGDRIEVEPSGMARSQLSALDSEGAKLLAANWAASDKLSYSEAPLLQGKNRDPDIAAWASKAITSAVSLAGLPQRPEPGSAGAVHLHPDTDPFVARYLPAMLGDAAGGMDPAGAAVPGAIDRTGQADAHWQVDTDSGRLTFRTLTAAEAAALAAERRRAVEAGELAGLDLDWGDLFAAITAGAAIVKKIDVSAVGQMVEAAITVFIDGVRHLFEAVITLVEQALDLAQEIFRLLLIPLEWLAGYLGWTPFWSAILRTHRALSYMVNQFAEMGTTIMLALKERVVAGIDAFEAWAQETMDEFIASVLPPETTLGSATQAIPPLTLPSWTTSQRNIFWRALMNNAPTTTRASDENGFNLPDNVTAAISKLLDLLTDYASKFRSSAVFEQAIEYFSRIGNDPDNMLTLTMAGLLKLAEAGALLLLDLAKTTAGLIFDAVIAVLDGLAAMLNDPWDVWVLSDLYSWITDGGTLSALDVYSLAAAIPVTGVYQDAFGQVPFPDEASLAAFQSANSAKSMLARCGFGDAALPPAPADESPYSFAYIVFGVSYGVFGVLESLIDLQPPLPAAGAQPNPAVVDRIGKGYWPPVMGAAGGWSLAKPVQILSTMALIAELSIQIWSCPGLISKHPTDWTCSTVAGQENIMWLVRFFEPIVDLGSLLSPYRSLLRSLDDVGAGVISFWGMFDCLLATCIGSATDDAWPAISASILATAPEMGKFLRTEFAVAETAGVSLVILQYMDLIFDIVVGVFFAEAALKLDKSGGAATIPSAQP